LQCTQFCALICSLSCDWPLASVSFTYSYTPAGQ